MLMKMIKIISNKKHQNTNHNVKKSNLDLNLIPTMRLNKRKPPKVKITLHNDHINYQEGKKITINF